jgi:hypothetical protein
MPVPRERFFLFAYATGATILPGITCRETGYWAIWGTTVDMRAGDRVSVEIGVRTRASNPADFPVPQGHFFTQTNSICPGVPWGYAVTNDAGIPFWDEFQRLGGVDALGYPVSRRFVYKGFVTQAFQKAVLQWQERGTRNGERGTRQWSRLLPEYL